MFVKDTLAAALAIFACTIAAALLRCMAATTPRFVVGAVLIAMLSTVWRSGAQKQKAPARGSNTDKRNPEG